MEEAQSPTNTILTWCHCLGRAAFLQSLASLDNPDHSLMPPEIFPWDTLQAEHVLSCAASLACHRALFQHCLQVKIHSLVRFESSGAPFIMSKLPSKPPQPVWVGACARGASDADRALVALAQGSGGLTR